jgi:hypothetical protein
MAIVPMCSTPMQSQYDLKRGGRDHKPLSNVVSGGNAKIADGDMQLQAYARCATGRGNEPIFLDVEDIWFNFDSWIVV